VISPSQRPLPTQDNTTQHRNTKPNIHATRGIRTRDPNNQEAADLCLRPHGHGIGKNNSSRDEIYEMTSRYTLTGHKTNTETAKELNITLVPNKIQGYKRKWI
jgi:hypothetical protein